MKFVLCKNTFLILILSLFLACSNDEFCTEPTESQAILNFYYRIGSILNDTTLNDFSVTGIIDYDSLLYDSAKTKSISLPFSASAISSSFIFAFSIPDTLYTTDTTSIDSQSTVKNRTNQVRNSQMQIMESADSMVIDTIIYHYLHDTISFFYSPVLHFISQACGFTYHYQVDSVNSTNNVIDTILINSELITTKENENFKVLL